MWTERQKGELNGPGETEIETDRRIVRDRISLLKDKIKAIDKQMGTQRGNRGAMVVWLWWGIPMWENQL
jgi:GTP-binding protein HflX